MMIVLLSRILFLAFVTKAAEIVVDDTPGEGDFTTIQAAELAASNGDTIVINPNSDSRGYREEVIVTTPNLTITGSKSGKRRGRTLKGANTKNRSSKQMKKKHGRRSLKSGKSGGEDSFPFDTLDKQGFPSLDEQPGCSDVFLDGCDNGGSCDNTVLTIRALGVTIENLFIRHGNIEFDSNADGGKVIESCLLGDSTNSVRTSGSPDSITISNNFFQGGVSNSASLNGNSHEISYNLVVPCDSGFYINGDDGLITGNKLFGCDDAALNYFGARGTIADNEIYHGQLSINYSGDDGIITSNTIIGVESGIDYSGANARITNNKISFVRFLGVDYNGDNGIIEDNEISSTSGKGINYAGGNGVITKNGISSTGDDGIQYEGGNGMITNNHISGTAGGDGIQYRGRNGIIMNNEICDATSEGIDYYGDNGTIEDNKISDTRQNGIEYDGDGGKITGNEISGVRRDGIEYGGDDGIITNNEISGASSEGIEYVGDKPTITHNIVEFTQTEGIKVNCDGSPTCTGGSVSYNKVIGGADDDHGVSIFKANNFLVEYNTISFFTERGLDFSGNDSALRSNLIARGGAEADFNAHAVEVNGNRNFIEDNTLNFNTFDGINQASGSDNVYRRNTINGNGRAGIRVEDGSTGTMISENIIFDNQGEGIAIEGGTSTEVLNNELTNNRIDICDDVGGSTVSGNTFTTGGYSTACEVGLS